jgi:hypothetical protein
MPSRLLHIFANAMCIHQTIDDAIWVAMGAFGAGPPNILDLPTQSRHVPVGDASTGRAFVVGSVH